MHEIDRKISDFATGILLRYFRSGVLLGADRPLLDHARELELLRAHWAVSASVREFIQYLLAHRHEAQSLLRFQMRTDDAIARGRIDARASVIARRTSGHSSLIISEEPIRSFNTGANQVIAWVVHMAATRARWLFDIQPKNSAYADLIKAAMIEISEVKRLDALRIPLKHVAVGRRPEPNAIRDAVRSRRLIYRHAAAAYKTLTEIEAGDEDTLSRVLSSTLIGPLEEWRRFELAVAVGLGEALSAELGKPPLLTILDAHPGQPVLRCGQYSVFWQSGGPPMSEPIEWHLKEIFAAYRMAVVPDRPDLIVVDDSTDRVAAVVEVKYLTGNTANARFREAAGQVVRYGQGYSGKTDLPRLIRRSLIVLSHDAPAIVDDTADAPRTVDFAGLLNGQLRLWIRERLLAVAH